ncbi:MAG: hypothetical protein IAG13_29075 [Deltaproteobacteria bacterium]|nr:hypothetical protein [Nannocystaceae bacterium]
MEALRCSGLVLLVVIGCESGGSDPPCSDACGADERGGSDDGGSEGTAPDDGSASESSSGVGELTESSTTPGEGVTTTHGAESSSGATECAGQGDPCAHEGDCCGQPGGALICVDEAAGATCHAACVGDDDCATGCCQTLHGGERACMAAEQCAHDCAPLLARCAEDADCCAGSSCVDAQCSVGCTEAAECPSACCGDDLHCSSAAEGGGDDACDEGTHFCQAGTTHFLCDDDAWYVVDCEAACIEAGHAGSSGCGWSDLYEDDVCLCAQG